MGWPFLTKIGRAPHLTDMKTNILLTAALGFFLIFGIARAATPEEKKAFIDGVTKEIEAKDQPAIMARFIDVGLFENNKRAFIKLSIEDLLGQKIESIELLPITPLPPEQQQSTEEKLSKAQVPMPSLLLNISNINKDGAHKTSKFPVSEKDGKLFIVW